MLGLSGLVALTICGGASDPAPAEKPAAEAPATEEPAAEAPAADPMANAVKEPLTGGPYPTLLMTQAQFVFQGGKPLPGPAKLTLWRFKGEGDWEQVVVEDGGSNVFHKAMPWRDGILTIGGEGARLKHWTFTDGTWHEEQLWEQSWGGKFDRLRDIEVGDVTGDGEENLIIATHDMGVVAVGTEGPDGWTFDEYDQQADTFVHEIEIGDVDHDGKMEFYATPSGRNKASGESQAGGVVRYDFDGEKFVRSEVVSWPDTHAKEILVADLDGKGDALYVVREGVSKKEGKAVKLVEGAQVVRVDKVGDSWTSMVVAQSEDHQARFLVPGDVDGDGQTELVFAGYKTGLWVLQPKGDATFEMELVDKNSGGFEHASHVADLDGDGAYEIYVASDQKGKQFRRYRWDGSAWARTVIADIGEGRITWNIQDGTF